MTSGSATLAATEGVPDSEARYPPQKDAEGNPVALAEQVILEAAGDRKILVRAVPIPANLGGLIQVSQASLTALGGAGQLTVQWRTARFRDLIRYSKESRRRSLGVLLAGISAVLAALKETFDGLDQKTSWLVTLFLVAALATLAKELSDAWQDIQSVRERA